MNSPFRPAEQLEQAERPAKRSISASLPAVRQRHPHLVSQVRERDRARAQHGVVEGAEPESRTHLPFQLGAQILQSHRATVLAANSGAPRPAAPRAGVLGGQTRGPRDPAGRPVGGCALDPQHQLECGAGEPFALEIAPLFRESRGPPPMLHPDSSM